MTNHFLELQNVSKTYFGVRALNNINLGFQRGRTLGLIGENGAGKSTMMNIVGGVVLPDEGGGMLLEGKPYTPRNPSEAKDSGIAFIHQELNLFTNLTIAENIFIDDFPRRQLGLIDRAALKSKTRDLLDSIGLDDLEPNTFIDDLSPGERQLVEILKAIHLDASMIIFDEPTTSLTARETERLFDIIAQFHDAGKTMVYISHILGDVLEVADDIAVLRDGDLIGTGPKEAFDINRMISMMIGRDLEQLFPPRTNQPTERVTLDIRGVSQPGIVKDINLQVHVGEVLGLFGLMGSGRTELARIVFGLDEYESGDILIDGSSTKGDSPADSIDHRVAFVTENRREEGLMMEALIADNISLVSLDEFTRTPAKIIDNGRMLDASRGMADALQVKSGAIDAQLAKSLSGGNQQKVVISKWLMSDPLVFIMDEPTRGVDVGAKYEIYSIINDLAAEGNSVLFISSELDELMGMCDRIIVMSRGEISGEFTERPFDEEAILRAAFREGGNGE